jgi:hypothetical protein
MQNELTDLIDNMLDHMPAHPLNKMTYVGKGYNKQQMLDQMNQLRELSMKYNIVILCAKQHTPENAEHNEMIRRRLQHEEAV